MTPPVQSSSSLSAVLLVPVQSSWKNDSGTRPQAPQKSCKTLVQKVCYRTNIFLRFLHHEDRLQDWLRARLHRCPGNPPATGCAPTRQVQPHLSGEGVWGNSRPTGTDAIAG